MGDLDYGPLYKRGCAPQKDPASTTSIFVFPPFRESFLLPQYFLRDNAFFRNPALLRLG